MDFRHRFSSVPPASSVSAKTLVEHPELRDILSLRAGEAGLERPLSHPRVQKSGLVLVKHATGIVPDRVQVFGETEMSYLETLDAETRKDCVEFLCTLRPSLIVVTRGVDPLPELIEIAEQTATPIAVAVPKSSTTINAIHTVLDRLLAPNDDRHGVFVEVHGVGVLLTGPSGIGKSECALFLVERGHRLVADDVVHLTCLPSGTIIGEPSPLLRHHLEIRGVGIINIRDLFGATAVRDSAKLHLIVDLCHWQEGEHYERLGLDEKTTEIFGQEVSTLRIPVRPGRDMGVILEIAARNHLLKQEGHNAAQNFAERLEAHFGVGGREKPEPTPE